jgi:catalase (peroxidase I)
MVRDLLIERTRSKQARNKAPPAPDSQPALRNYLRAKQPLSAEELLVDRAQLLTLTVSDMTVPSRGPLQLYSKTSRLA